MVSRNKTIPRKKQSAPSVKFGRHEPCPSPARNTALTQASRPSDRSWEQGGCGEGGGGGTGVGGSLPDTLPGELFHSPRHPTPSPGTLHPSL